MLLDLKPVIREQLFNHQVNLGVAYFRICDHVNAVKMAERAKNLNGFMNINIETRYLILYIIAHSKLYFGINSRNDRYVNEAEEIILSEFSQVDKIKKYFFKTGNFR